MDKNIKMSYCRFKAFKVLAGKYLDLKEHELFGEIQQLLEETDVPPADVAENLMLMPMMKKRDANTCLKGLVEALKKAKEEAAAAKALSDAKRNEKEAKGAQANGDAAKPKEGSEEEEEKEMDSTPTIFRPWEWAASSVFFHLRHFLLPRSSSPLPPLPLESFTAALSWPPPQASFYRTVDLHRFEHPELRTNTVHHWTFVTRLPPTRFLSVCLHPLLLGSSSPLEVLVGNCILM
ncbi:hypothetical protein BAE44_0025905 [Dichanthelium oligosanthes]|uniref:AAA+ ATPase At3g28540-like C-terminal domain-containing protein n=1 Tax=Dichanthelium oligosanthes TaxID=888268 RepID=A0A1E5UJL4_9POAL|nr:hypothetical protein BAE44_0025905 [Dichanthelium oligosanthes]